MIIKKIQDADLKYKKVLMRVDFNVAIKDGHVQEKFRIAACKETVEYILSQEGVKLALVSHWGRPSFTEVIAFEKSPGGKSSTAVTKKYSLDNLREGVEKILDRKVNFVSDCVGNKVATALEKLNENEILLLENVRLHSGDEVNDLDFAKKLAENFDVFVNEAFSVCHRDQASVTGIAGIVPAFAGLRLQQEIENLDKVKEKPEHPAVAIIGGAKIETKLPLIKFFESRYDKVLVGGKIAVEAKNADIPFSEKVILPLDYQDDQKDIGPETIKKFKAVIFTAKTVVWNGPLGKFEEPPYDAGTREVLKAVTQCQAFSVVGGGESIQALEEQELMDKVSFVSTGGGAMLEYMSGNKLPGIEVLMV
jgi:phosphoglycerate kinase